MAGVAERQLCGRAVEVVVLVVAVVASVVGLRPVSVVVLLKRQRLLWLEVVLALVAVVRGAERLVEV